MLAMNSTSQFRITVQDCTNTPANTPAGTRAGTPTNTPTYVSPADTPTNTPVNTPAGARAGTPTCVSPMSKSCMDMTKLDEPYKSDKLSKSCILGMSRSLYIPIISQDHLYNEPPIPLSKSSENANILLDSISDMMAEDMRNKRTSRMMSTQEIWDTVGSFENAPADIPADIPANIFTFDDTMGDDFNTLYPSQEINGYVSYVPSFPAVSPTYAKHVRKTAETSFEDIRNLFNNGSLDSCSLDDIGEIMCNMDKIKEHVYLTQ